MKDLAEAIAVIGVLAIAAMLVTKCTLVQSKRECIEAGKMAVETCLEVYK